MQLRRQNEKAEQLSQGMLGCGCSGLRFSQFPATAPCSISGRYIMSGHGNILPSGMTFRIWVDTRHWVRPAYSSCARDGRTLLRTVRMMGMTGYSVLPEKNRSISLDSTARFFAIAGCE